MTFETGSIDSMAGTEAAGGRAAAPVRGDTGDEADRHAASDADAQFLSKARHSLRQQLYAMKLLGQSALSHGAARDGALRQLIDVLEDFEPYLMSMLRFARSEARAAPARPGRTALQGTFQRLNLQFDDVVDGTDVDLRIRPTGIYADTDADMLFELMRQLVANALRFARSRVLVAARRRQGVAVLEVWDDGRGIPAEAMGKVFDPFYSTSPGAGLMPGPGLGLPTARMLAGKLGCVLAVDSEFGKGTRVRVTMP
jgi:signal transduction histidine kinase